MCVHLCVRGVRGGACRSRGAPTGRRQPQHCAQLPGCTARAEQPVAWGWQDRSCRGRAWPCSHAWQASHVAAQLNSWPAEQLTLCSQASCPHIVCGAATHCPAAGAALCILVLLCIHDALHCDLNGWPVSCPFLPAVCGSCQLVNSQISAMRATCNEEVNDVSKNSGNQGTAQAGLVLPLAPAYS